MKKLIVHSRTFGTKEIILDDEDYQRVSELTWTFSLDKGTKNFYFNCSKFRIGLARFIMNCPKNKIVDHIDHNTLDNRKANLRICTIQESNRNRRTRKDSKNKYKGLNFLPSYKKWTTLIKINGKMKTVGHSNSKIEAGYLYNVHAKKEHGEFAYLNSINEKELNQARKNSVAIDLMLEGIDYLKGIINNKPEVKEEEILQIIESVFK